MIAISDKKVASGVVKIQKIISDKSPIAVAKIVAFVLLMSPVTIGRLEVLAINLSLSLSITILNALALPADRVPARIVVATNEKDGSPLAARTIAGRVETKSSSTTRSFIKCMYPRTTLFMAIDYLPMWHSVYSDHLGLTPQPHKGRGPHHIRS